MITEHVAWKYSFVNQLDAKSFLEMIWPKELLRYETLELRAIRRKDNTMKRKFFESIGEFLDYAKKLEKGWDIYYGVSTRFQSGGKKVDCYRVNCVWLDLDTKKQSSFHPVTPDIIVNSGSGHHIYWVFKSPVFIRSGRWKEVEAVNRALCKKFGGDIASIDVSRILRVPGFRNHKYDPPQEVQAFVQSE